MSCSLSVNSIEYPPQYKGRIFKVALFDRWLLVLTGKRHIEELQKFPDDQVSFLYGTAEVNVKSSSQPLLITLADTRHRICLWDGCLGTALPCHRYPFRPHPTYGIDVRGHPRRDGERVCVPGARNIRR